MELLVQLNQRDLLSKLESKKVAIVVGLDYFSSRSLVKMSVEELIDIQYAYPIYVLVNRLFDQSDIALLEETLIRLNDAPIQGLIFGDFAVMSICQKHGLKFDLIYSSDTLNTSHGSINAIASLGAKGCFLANQLHENEVTSIIENSQTDLFIQIHGKQYISHSKRKLLTNYFEFNQIDHQVDYDSKIVMKVNNTEMYSHIYEDQFGTHIFTQNELCLKDYLDIMPCKYGYFETMYLDSQYILELIDFYRSNQTYDDLVHQYPTHHYDTGFFSDGTVYKLEDVRKREANEKC